MKADMTKSLVGEHPEIISTFLIPFFKELEEAKIIWAVSHGWEGLPYYARHDVDLVAEKIYIKKIARIINDVSLKTGWKSYAQFRFSNLYSYWLVHSNGPSYFQIDIEVGCGMRGVQFLDVSSQLSERWKNSENIWCMTSAYAATWVLLKELVSNGKLERYSRQESVVKSIEKDPKKACEVLAAALRGEQSLAGRIVSLCRNREWDLLSGLAYDVRRVTMRPRIGDVPKIVRYAFDNIRMRVFPFLRPFIVFVGPDGCGKTTICDKVVERFDHRPLVSIRRIHSHFGNMPRLRDVYQACAKLVGRKVEYLPDPEPGTRGIGMTKPLSRLRSMFYVLYYGIGLSLARVTLFRWRTFSGLLLADRYYYDYYFMRGYLNCPQWWLTVIEIIVPKPDLIFVLERPAEEIYRQKPELDVQEIVREQTVIRKCFGNRKHVWFIDAAHGIDATTRNVTETIERWIESYGCKLTK